MKFSFVLIVLLFLLSCQGKKEVVSFYMPAEWEPQDAVWFGWEDEDTGYYRPVADMMKGLIGNVQIKVAVRSDSLLATAKDYLERSGIDTAKLLFFVMPGERYWIRDHGAAFLVNDKGKLAVADFGWSLYGIEGWYRQYFNNNKDSVDKRLAKFLDGKTGKIDSMMAAAANASIIKTDMIIEGGAIEVNGKGTLILCEAVTFQRNPGKTKDQLEAGFKKVLGVSKIIWLKKGLAEDEHIRQLQLSKYMTMGTGGHTDEFVRFAGPNTILLAWVDEEEINSHAFNKINYDRMNENFNILSKATDQDGKPFNIIKVPLPAPIERKIVVKETVESNDSFYIKPSSFLPNDRPQLGDTLINVAASSYLNYLVSNNVVLLPTYVAEGSPAEKENRVRKIFENVFPHRKQVMIRSMPINWNGGGIHCSTQQQPKVK